MSNENQAVDNATQSVATSQPVAPPSQAGESPVSTPAPVDTTASEAQPEADEAKKRQSRSESRAFATIRRENRELYRQIGALQATVEGLRPAPAEGAQPQERPAQGRETPDPRSIKAADMALERIEEAGEEIEDFGDVVQTITARGFPISEPMRDYLAGVSEKPAHVAQFLAKNPREAERIAVLSEGMARAALEKVEAKLAAAPKAPPKKVTGAPPPVSTVGGGSNASFEPSKAGMDDYAAWRRRQA